jgi:transcriptional regulator with XRE-family HTH domain
LPSFAERLRRYRVEAGLTQEELAELAGISARGLSDLERGIRSTPYRDTIRRLADALKLTDAERTTLTTAVHRPMELTTRGAARQPSLPTLPIPRTRLVGREREVAEVQGLLGTTNLLTLVGAGGIRKTTVARRSAGSWIG